MKRRIPFFLLFFLSACSSLSTFQSAYKVTGPLHVSMAGISSLGHDIPFNVAELQKRLPSYTISPISKNALGMSIIQVQRAQKTLLTLYPDQASHLVLMVEVNDDSIVTDPRLHHKIPYAKLFIGHRSSCLPGVGQMARRIVCQVPANPAFVYIFMGPWDGPVGKMPPETVLNSWLVEQIYWFPTRLVRP